MIDSNERRADERAAINAVVGIDTSDRKDRVGVTRNLSSRGALFHSASRFSRGERLHLMFHDPVTERDRQVTARVVRTDVDSPERGNFFRHLTAVEFDEPIER